MMGHFQHGGQTSYFISVRKNSHFSCAFNHLEGIEFQDMKNHVCFFSKSDLSFPKDVKSVGVNDGLCANTISEKHLLFKFM